MKDKNSTVWELTTKFQKTNSEIDYMSAAILNENNLESNNRTEDLFLISNQVKVSLIEILYLILIIIKNY